MASALTPAALTLDNVGYAYLGRTVLDRIDLTLAPGEVVALVGPSGCGKSTLAHIAAGVLEPRHGHLERSYRRHGMVFQEARLMPWATTRENIAYPLRLAGVSRRDRAARAEAAAARVALDIRDLDKYPAELSGGMMQRAAIARALVAEPDFVYFDEPFTALDVALKRRMQNLVIEASRALHFGALFITHDLSEAVRVAHRIAVMDLHGRGIVGDRLLPGMPGDRDEATVYTLAAALAKDPAFRHIHDVDERRLP
ncbi:MAG: ABC transporter ATPase [Rhodospirillaceae bacterium BRH_c57]|nr:MAG: ABC transporter ATPase [Rhodospirillaceae bacterium BRH_c57]